MPSYTIAIKYFEGIDCMINQSQVKTYIFAFLLLLL